jgi:hypothetical protein
MEQRLGIDPCQIHRKKEKHRKPVNNLLVVGMVWAETNLMQSPSNLSNPSKSKNPISKRMMGMEVLLKLLSRIRNKWEAGEHQRSQLPRRSRSGQRDGKNHNNKWGLNSSSKDGARDLHSKECRASRKKWQPHIPRNDLSNLLDGVPRKSTSLSPNNRNCLHGLRFGKLLPSQRNPEHRSRQSNSPHGEPRKWRNRTSNRNDRNNLLDGELLRQKCLPSNDNLLQDGGLPWNLTSSDSNQDKWVVLT